MDHPHTLIIIRLTCMKLPYICEAFWLAGSWPGWVLLASPIAWAALDTQFYYYGSKASYRIRRHQEQNNCCSSKPYIRIRTRKNERRNRTRKEAWLSLHRTCYLPIDQPIISLKTILLTESSQVAGWKLLWQNRFADCWLEDGLDSQKVLDNLIGIAKTSTKNGESALLT